MISGQPRWLVTTEDRGATPALIVLRWALRVVRRGCPFQFTTNKQGDRTWKKKPVANSV